jgi:hypothetical protein
MCIELNFMKMFSILIICIEETETERAQLAVCVLFVLLKSK